MNKIIEERKGDDRENKEMGKKKLVGEKKIIHIISLS